MPKISNLAHLGESTSLEIEVDLAFSVEKNTYQCRLEGQFFFKKFPKTARHERNLTLW